MEPIIRIKDLNLYYDQFHALKDVSMDIPGESSDHRFYWTVWLWKVNAASDAESDE